MWWPEGSGGFSDGPFDVFAQPQGREPKDQSLEAHRAARPLHSPEGLEAMTHQATVSGPLRPYTGGTGVDMPGSGRGGLAG
jgi:hypothetical protein